MDLQKNTSSAYGEYTIRSCGLNRAELVLDRIPALQPMRVLRTHIINRLDQWTDSPAELADIMSEVDALAAHAHPEQPYAGMAAAYVDDFREELDRWRVAHGLRPF